MGKRFKVFVLGAAMLFMFGCASAGVNSLGQIVLPDGSTVNHYASMAPQPWGIDGATIDRYQTESVYDPQLKKFVPKTKLIAHDAGFSDGTGKRIVTQLPGQLIQAGEILGGAYLLTPSTTSVVAGNNSGNMSQKQGQLQLQGQNQNVKNTNTVKNTNVNDIKNTNLNTNKNDIKNTNYNKNTNANLNLNNNYNKVEGGSGEGNGNNGNGSQGNNGQGGGGGSQGNPGNPH